jgi:hypothetical protein
MRMDAQACTNLRKRAQTCTNLRTDATACAWMRQTRSKKVGAANKKKEVDAA